MAQNNFETLSNELIVQMLDLDVEEVNFKRSQQYVMSNLLYHRFLDVNKREVKKRFDGVIEKFMIHGHQNVSEKLQSLIKSLNTAEVFDNDHAELQWSILSFLLDLSQHPTEANTRLCLIEETKDTEEAQATSAWTTTQWSSYLLQDVPKYRIDPEDPLSDWSSSSSDSEPVIDAEENMKRESVDSAIVRCNTPPPPTLSRGVINEAYLSQTQLDFIVQPSYWANSSLDITSSHPIAIVPSTESNNEVLVKEYHVVRELIWLLMRPSSGFIFTRGNDGYISIDHKIALSSLTKTCLSSLLKRVEKSAAKLEEIDAWLAQTQGSSENILPPPLRSYAIGLHLWRSDVIQQLVHIEAEIRERDKCPSLMWLLNKLQPLLSIVDLVSNIHSQAFNCSNSQSHPFRLISVLVQNIESSTDGVKRTILVHLFLHSLRYYLIMLSLWLQRSSQPPNSLYFILYRNEEITPKDPEFWSKAYTDTIPGCKTTLTEELNYPGLGFLRILRAPLAEIGCIHELLDINYKGQEYKHILDECDIEETLIIEIAKICGSYNESLYKESPPDQSLVNSGTNEMPCFDPYLMEAFKEQSRPIKPTQDKVTRIIEDINCKHSIKIDKVIANILLPIIKCQQTELGESITNILIEQYNLEEHLLVVRSVYLLEAGDIMNDFFTQFFTMINNKEIIEEITLTQNLQYWIGRKFENLAQNFSVSFNKQDDQKPNCTRQDYLVSSISVNYKAPWPVYLVLTEDVIKKYNKLLQFCLSMKRAIGLLQRLHFRELANQMGNEESSISETTKANPSPLPWRLHRLQLLRQWLLYFSNVVHDHFATTALMPFHYNMVQLLENRPNMGTLLTEHDKLLDDVSKQCLLPEDNKQSPVQDTFAKVFAVVEEVARLWVGSPSDITTDYLAKLEDNYTVCHRFLVNLLIAITRSQYNPHLEALSLALVNSCPIQIKG